MRRAGGRSSRPRAPGRRCRPTMRSSSRMPSGSTAPSTNCERNRPSSSVRLLHADRPVREHRDRERRLRRGEEQLLALQRRRSGGRAATPTRSRTRSAGCRRAASTGSPSTTPARRAPEFVFSRHANSPAISSSGASDASGASHCTSRNSSIPNCAPGRRRAPRRTASAHARITPAANTNMQPDHEPARAGRQRADRARAGPTRCGSSAGARAIRARGRRRRGR